MKKPIEYEKPCDICGDDVMKFGIPNYSNDPTEKEDIICEFCKFNENYNEDKLSEIRMNGVDSHDSPDFTDSYLESALYDGVPLTERQLEWINEHKTDNFHQWAYESLIK